MNKVLGNGVLGSVLLVLAVLLFTIGTQNVVAVQRVLLLSPADILPLILCIVVPAVVFLIGSIKAFQGSLTLSYQSGASQSMDN